MKSDCYILKLYQKERKLIGKNISYNKETGESRIHEAANI